MYAEHFGFKEKPFSIKDNPDAFYHNANYDGAYTAILSGILESEGCIVLTGEAGIGKTVLLRRLMTQYSEKNIYFIYCPNTIWEFNDLLIHIDRELNLNSQSTEQAHLLQNLQDWLVAQRQEDKVVVLMLDNAHILPNKVLQHLPLLYFSNTPAAGTFRILLAGLPLLEEKLESNALQPLRETINVRKRLPLLPDSEIASFIEQQLSAAGYQGQTPFPPPVIAPITRLAKGLPRSIASLCDAALFLASLESAKTVTPEIIDEAANLALISQESISQQETSLSGLDPEASPVLEEGSITPKENGKVSETAENILDIGSDIQLPPLKLDFDGNETQREETVEPSSSHTLEKNSAKENSALTGKMLEEPTEALIDLPQAKESSAEKRILAFDKNFEYEPEQPSVLCALVMNPDGLPLREVSVRCHSPHLSFSDHPRPRRIKLLGRRDASLVYLKYRGPADSLETTLAFQVDVRDHRGEWQAYNSRQDILLRFRSHSGKHTVKIRIAGNTTVNVGLQNPPNLSTAEQFSETPESVEPLSLDDNLASQDATFQKSNSLEQMVVVELALDNERTQRLQTEAVSRPQFSTRGRFMSRAILRSQNPDYAPERIELVSRPFMVFGRYNEASHLGFADFALGFLPQYLRISRLHCAICAMDDGLAIMHTGAHESSYTSLNNKRLARGHWQRIESGDIIDVSGLYDLRVVLAWDTLPSSPNDLSESIQGETIGKTLLQTVELLKRMENTKSNALREELKTCFVEMIRLQDEAARLNGVDSLGPLLYARFQRMDDKQHRVTHVYLPKWISIGSSPQAGLYVKVKGIAPKHAELLFKDGMFWIQDHAGLNDVRVGGHRLKLYEAIPLENGDIVDIATARFVFESY